MGRGQRWWRGRWLQRQHRRVVPTGPVVLVAIIIVSFSFFVVVVVVVVCIIV
jgi:uncharacterized membrane protein